MNFQTLKDWIYFYFYEKPEPVFVFEDRIIPAASVWTGVREWVRFFRKLELKKGDRVCIALPYDISFVMVLLACIWEELTVFLLKDTEYNENSGKELDCKLDIANSTYAHTVVMQDFLPDYLESTRSTHLLPSSDVLFFLKTSGTTQKAKWIGLSEKNILSVLNSHAPLLTSKSKVQISSLPWSHAFGLVLDLFAGISTSSVIIRDMQNGKDIEKIISLIQNHPNSFWSTVPLSIERVLDLQKEEVCFLLGGGIIGGAPISKKIADVLQGSNLRVGYGQTEASPGITLGDKGKFYPFYLGKPLGCEVRINSDSELEFRGTNTFIAEFVNSEINYFKIGRWVQTKDLCSELNGEIFFLGRKDNSFKLANGKMFFPEDWEKQIQAIVPEIGEICILEKKGEVFLFVENSNYLEKNFWLSYLPNSLLNFHLIHLQEFPKYPKGGVNRKELKNLLEEKF